MSEITLAHEWGMYINNAIGDPALPQNDASNDYARYAVTTGAVVTLFDTPDEGVALPVDATHAYIVCENAAVRFRIAADPTTTEGVKWYADTSHPMENQRGFLANVRFIGETATATLTIMWGRQP